MAIDENFIYIRGRLDEIADKVSEFKVYIDNCTRDKNLLFDHVRGLKDDVTELKTQATGKNKTFDIAIKILMLLVSVGVLISGIVFWIIRLSKG